MTSEEQMAVERLKELGRFLKAEAGRRRSADFHKDCAAIDILLASLAKLEEENERLTWLYNDAKEKWNADVQEFAPRAEAAEARLAALSTDVEAVIQRGCQHDMGFDREQGPLGCDLGDACVCIGWGVPLRATLSQAAPVGDGAGTAERALKQARQPTRYPDYIDDPEGYERLRDRARTENGHAFTVCNNNSVWRLVETVERLKRAVKLAAPPLPPAEGAREKIARSDDGQLIQQVRDLLAKVMRHDDLATIGMVTASEGWLEPPAHQYWKVSARVTPKLESVKPYGTTLALTQNPHVAGLLCILSTGLPRLLDLAADAILSREQESGR